MPRQNTRSQERLSLSEISSHFRSATGELEVISHSLYQEKLITPDDWAVDYFFDGPLKPPHRFLVEAVRLDVFDDHMKLREEKIGNFYCQGSLALLLGSRCYLSGEPLGNFLGMGYQLVTGTEILIEPGVDYKIRLAWRLETLRLPTRVGAYLDGLLLRAKSKDKNQ